MLLLDLHYGFCSCMVLIGLLSLLLFLNPVEQFREHKVPGKLFNEGNWDDEALQSSILGDLLIRHTKCSNVGPIATYVSSSNHLLMASIFNYLDLHFSRLCKVTNLIEMSGHSHLVITNQLILDPVIRVWQKERPRYFKNHI